MGTEIGFEQAWLAKFSQSLERVAGAGIRDEVMAGSEGLSSKAGSQDVSAWTQRAMEVLDARVPEAMRREVMLGCACRYPTPDLADIRDAYAASGDVGVADGQLDSPDTLPASSVTLRAKW